MATVPERLQTTIRGAASAANQAEVFGAMAIVAVTKADADLPDGPCRALLVGTAGTANVKDVMGNTSANIPLVAGYNFLQLLQVRTGGTATDIWALY